MPHETRTPLFRNSRFMRTGEDEKIRSVQDALRSGELHPVDEQLFNQIVSANRVIRSPQQQGASADAQGRMAGASDTLPPTF